MTDKYPGSMHKSFWFYSLLIITIAITCAGAGISYAGQTTVLNGIDVLQRDGFAQLDGRVIGLITNHTGINRSGNSTIQLLHSAPGVKLVALFSPEHGPVGKLDVSHIDNTIDAATGINIISLYGKRRRPSSDMLKGIDTLVFDIQDIGTRFYTYISTMGEAMQAAAENDIRFVVLDRPNPINGNTVSGPILDEGRQSFVGYHRLPIRHGMTTGELAKMFNAELRLGLDLKIIPLGGWRRADYFDATGLKWINPSPNMRSLTEAILYPGIGLLETTNLSVGRGTATPFELFGAPWLDGESFAQELNKLNLPGVRFTPLKFTPESSKFAGELCGGVSIHITDRMQLESVRTGLEIALKLRRLYVNDWDVDAFDRLLGNRAVLEAVRSGLPYPVVETTFHDDLMEFLQRRSPFLIYH